MLDKKVQVKEIRDLGARNYLLTLRSPDQARLTRPGQFLMVKCGAEIDADPLLRRPFSVYNVRSARRAGRKAWLDILVKSVGAGTRALAELVPGDEVFALGPQGRPFDVAAALAARTRVACLVAGGVGIAALYLLARDLASAGVTPVLFYGGRSEADLVLGGDFEALGIETVYATEDGSRGAAGLVTAPLEDYLRRHRRGGVRIYCCGPWGMMKATHELAVRFGVPCDVSLEARMGCSLGACMGCVVRTWDEAGEEQYSRVCQEGPVMTSRQIDWDTPPL
ncbi:MAG: dihydroorotate dehydrogenase electron transfer subunit [Acidobacteria bacterium]|nr:MAG: dihydroorotate dehydrogenase electron transfer subunit [Acidobacteriota bacterium]